MTPPLKNPFAVALFAAVLLAGPAAAQDQKYRNRDNPNLNDAAEGVYPIPYQMPTKAEIVESLNRVRGFLEVTALTEVVDRRTGQPITDMANPVATATFKTGPKLFGPVGYEMGVVHAGMLHAGRVTGDARFTAFTERHMNFIHQWLPYFRKAETAFKLDRANPFRAALDPRALDDSGSMAAALIRARLAKVGPDLKPQIDVWTDWVGNKQFRFPDGTLARQRPQAESLWADDAYMSIPALAEMGRLTGEKKWFDDAVKQALQLSKHLFVPGERALHARPSSPQSRGAVLLLGPRQRLDRGGAVRSTRRSAQGPSGFRAGQGSVGRGAARRGRAPVGQLRPLAPDARSQRFVSRDLGFGDVCLRARPRGQPGTGSVRPPTGASRSPVGWACRRRSARRGR